MNTRQATPQEAARIARIDRRALGYGVNPCQSIPPRHTLYTATNGRTYCTTCGQETTERS